MKEPDVFTLPVFPAAEAFPMLGQDDLAELADDIRANGLHEPIVLAEAEVPGSEETVWLIDGRNRRAACRIAGVEPDVRWLNGEDPTAYVISANIHRRHMNAGQRAMAVALIYPDPEKGGRGKKGVRHEHVSRPMVEKGRTVLRHSPMLAPLVLSGATTLDAAYEKAKEDQRQAESEASRLQRLEKRYPDLAAKVQDQELTLKGAEAEANARDEIDINGWRLAVANLVDGVHHIGQFADSRHVDSVSNWIRNPAKKHELLKAFATARTTLDVDQFIAGAKALAAFIKALSEENQNV